MAKASSAPQSKGYDWKTFERKHIVESHYQWEFDGYNWVLVQSFVPRLRAEETKKYYPEGSLLHKLTFSPCCQEKFSWEVPYRCMKCGIVYTREELTGVSITKLTYQTTQMAG